MANHNFSPNSLHHTAPVFPMGPISTPSFEYGYETLPVAPAANHDRMKQNPLESLEIDELDLHVKDLFERQFKGKNLVTEEELIIGARLARSNYANHERDPNDNPDHVGSKQFTPSILTVKWVLHPHDWKALDIQKSKKFWKEPKALLVTLAICCVAPMIQGWNQVANGNLGWPISFGVRYLDPQGPDPDVWEFGLVNAYMWFAAMAGPVLFDPICNATWFTRGRRGSTLIAACFSLAGSIGASRSQTMTELIVWRVFLGIGIGAVAAIVPVWESEVLPPAKRGRVLVSWQAFVAIGLLIGSGATYFFRNHSDDCKENYYDCKYDHNDRKVDDWWRNQILSGTIPTIILLILVYIGCESPRWLIVQEKYLKAFETLIELRKERLLAAEEFCYTYFQVQTERALARKETGPDFRTYQRPISYRGRLWRVVSLVRNRRALVATLIVMMTQTLSGINIFAFHGTYFYIAANLGENKQNYKAKQQSNLSLTLIFAAATVVGSVIAYFLVEPLPVDTSLDDLSPADTGAHPALGIRNVKNKQKRVRELQRLLRGRRRLLLISLASGTAMLGGLTGVLNLPENSNRKLGAVMGFAFFLGMCYSPGVGAVPFLYSAEVWPNEARDVGMSVGVLVNFFGAGMISLVVPTALRWDPVKTFCIFIGLSTLAFLLVFFFVPCTNQAVSLEEMGAIFDHSLFRHAWKKAKDAFPIVIAMKEQKAMAPYNPGPYNPGPYNPGSYNPGPRPQPLRSHSAPLPGPQPYVLPVSTPYGPYAYSMQQTLYQAPPIPYPYAPPVPHPYYNVPVAAQYSPYGSFSLQQSHGVYPVNEPPPVNEQSRNPSATEPIASSSSNELIGQHHS